MIIITKTPAGLFTNAFFLSTTFPLAGVDIFDVVHLNIVMRVVDASFKAAQF